RRIELNVRRATSASHCRMRPDFSEETDSRSSSRLRSPLTITRSRATNAILSATSTRPPHSRLQPDLSTDALQSLLLLEVAARPRPRYSAGGSRREQPRRPLVAPRFGSPLLFFCELRRQVTPQPHQIKSNRRVRHPPTLPLRLDALVRNQLPHRQPHRSD